ncbi:16S rRNA methyltransferase [Sporanaerobium hydrogeniformans]|uniref:16S rRNA methyltransferase n=1 Tax=Sporanaerobium hydrogeniformans TaxID=3072179 RepID=A0AC61DF21_9FIRM|nr:RsmE family RNA methyltransferase [Sporanaerobium hydrogeniformans]PHV71517.1 16S rRNA methyltransferase [Sporanaerobium hydrogeniformans]
MAKFFVEPCQIKEDTIHIIGPDVNHIKNVLRLDIQKEILINDRQGIDYKCIINKIEDTIIYTKIVDKQSSDTEPLVKTVLFQSLVKGEKMEFVIQKGVEIGVTTIIPIMTERCVVKIESDKKLQAKLDRWNKIAESAAKQSKRGIVPQVERPLSLKEAIDYVKTHLEGACIPFENEDKYSLKAYLKTTPLASVGVFIGPEGGFTDEEIRQATSKGIVPVTLGKRILRSETAGLVVLANIMYEIGGV